jgi:hypothetical protein
MFSWNFIEVLLLDPQTSQSYEKEEDRSLKPLK